MIYNIVAHELNHCYQGFCDYKTLIKHNAEKTIRQIFHSPLYNSFSKYVMNVFRELYLYNENKSNLNKEYNYLLNR